MPSARLTLLLASASPARRTTLIAAGVTPHVRVSSVDEDAAVADLEGCVQRLQRARQAKTTLAHLPADQLRTVLQMRRRDLGGDPA